MHHAGSKLGADCCNKGSQYPANDPSTPQLGAYLTAPNSPNPPASACSQHVLDALAAFFDACQDPDLGNEAFSAWIPSKLVNGETYTNPSSMRQMCLSLGVLLKLGGITPSEAVATTLSPPSQTHATTSKWQTTTTTQALSSTITLISSEAIENKPDSQSSSHIPVSVIAGTTVAGITLLAILVVCIVYCLKRTNRATRASFARWDELPTSPSSIAVHPTQLPQSPSSYQNTIFSPSMDYASLSYMSYSRGIPSVQLAPDRSFSSAMSSDDPEPRRSTRLKAAISKSILGSSPRSWSVDQAASWAHGIPGIGSKIGDCMWHQSVNGSLLLSLTREDMGQRLGLMIEEVDALEEAIGGIRGLEGGLESPPPGYGIMLQGSTESLDF
ncbi:hypothetical protein BC830DRAFT_1168380 [Chytriomyces sp. MP71]|nr:hypothetical protein BC830DRAFT_1168380 [Chytriomyces sp. MP71]